MSITLAAVRDLMKSRMAERATAPTACATRPHAVDTRPIVCDICHQRRRRAPDAQQDICAPCLHAERVKAGIEAHRKPVELERVTGRPVVPPAPAREPAPPVSQAPASRKKPAIVWVVVPHRYQSGVDSGGGFVAREADLLADGTARLLTPYDGAPIQGRPHKRRSDAERLADKLSGYGPKKKISRLDAAERIAKALGKEGYTTRVRFDQEHPEETIHVVAERGTRPHQIGIVEIRSDGRIGYDRDFALFYDPVGKGVTAIVDKTIAGLDVDPGMNPPPQRRMEIEPWEAAFDIARLADDEARAFGVGDERGYGVDLAPHKRGDTSRPREVILRRRTPGHHEVARVYVHHDGRIELSEHTEPGERASIEALVARALDGRRVMPKKAQDDSPGGRWA